MYVSVPRVVHFDWTCKFLEFNELNLVIKKKKTNMIDIVSIEILFFG
jgi:ribosome biogenesis protein Tsr3